MRNASDRMAEMLIDSLMDVELSEEQMELVERYLEGSESECKLSVKRITPLFVTDSGKPLSGWSNAKSERRAKVEKCFEQLEKRNEDALLKRYLDVTIEIFGATLYPVLNWRKKAKSMLTKPQRIALLAQETGDIHWSFHSEGYRKVRAQSEDNEDFKRALEYTNPDDCNADLVIYTAMFYEGRDQKPWDGAGLDGFRIDVSELAADDESNAADGDNKGQEDGSTANGAIQDKSGGSAGTGAVQAENGGNEGVGIASSTISSQAERSDYSGNGASQDKTAAEGSTKSTDKQNTGRKKGILQKLSGLFSGGSDGKAEKAGGADQKSARFESNDAVKQYPEQFARYEHLLAHNGYAVYTASLSDAQISLLRDYIANGGDKPVPENIIAITQHTNLKEPLAALLIGCAAPNYRLSPVLYRFLKVCMSGNHYKQTLELMWKTQCRQDMDAEVIHWYADFAPDENKLIEWAGNHELNGVLAFMAKRNPDTYIQTAQKANLELYRKLTAPLKTGVGAAFYMKHFEDVFTSNQTNVQVKVMANIINTDNAAAKQAAQDYLNGEAAIDTLYPMLDSYRAASCRAIASYRDVYGEDAFYARCVAFLSLGNRYLRALYSKDLDRSSDFDDDTFIHFYDTIKREGIDIYHRVNIIAEQYDNDYRMEKMELEPAVIHVFEQDFKENREETAKAFLAAPVPGRILGIRTLAVHALQYKEELLAYMGDSSKQVREEIVNVLSSHPRMAEDVVSVLTTSKKAGEREVAATVIGSYQDVSAYTDVLTEALEKEKSKKVADYIRRALVAGGAMEAGEEGAAAGNGLAGAGFTVESYIKECHRGGKKRTLEWLYKDPMPMVYFADLEKSAGGADAGEDRKGALDGHAENAIDENRRASGSDIAAGNTEDATSERAAGEQNTMAGNVCEKGSVTSDNELQGGPTSKKEPASEEYMQAILLAYSGMGTPGVNREVHILTDCLNQQQLNTFMDVVFERFLAAGAEAKKKWVLYAASIHGGSPIVDKLKHQINEWAGASRGAMAAEAVKALSLNDSPLALVTVDGIARKYKYKQVKKAASDAMQFAAEQLNLTVEELADRIVPDLGFDENMERHFDYGSRTFTVRISPSLEIEVSDESGKVRKALPAVGKSDDPEKAERALAEFKELKKQMKATVKNQALRLELALSIDRKWTVEGFRNLFVKNPIMHQFAISLIWGYYEGDELLTTFRYMEDGTFNTVDEDEYALSGDGKVGLMHPIEMTKDEIEQWKEQLSDYEITQSIEQLNRPIYAVSEDEIGKKHLERFGGTILNGLSLSGKLVGLGWSKGVPMDAGIYEEFYRRDTEAGMGVELRFSGAYIGDENEDVIVYDASFYKLEDMDSRGYRYDMKVDEKAIDLDEVSKRYFSEVVYQITRATGSSTGTDPTWRDGRSVSGWKW